MKIEIQGEIRSNKVSRTYESSQSITQTPGNLFREGCFVETATGKLKVGNVRNSLDTGVLWTSDMQIKKKNEPL